MLIKPDLKKWNDEKPTYFILESQEAEKNLKNILKSEEQRQTQFEKLN